MFIDIEDLREEPLHFHHVYRIGDLMFQHEDAALDKPVVVNFRLTHEDRDLRLDGTLETSVRYSCSRCLKPLSQKVATRFDLFYLPQPKRTNMNEEIELKYEEMDIGFYDGIRLDVDVMVLEQIELSLPMRFICRDDCKGLCQMCGADLNDGACLCKEVEADSRLAVLLDFRKKMESK